MTDRFTLLSELGRGGMGVVWKARDEETGQVVALKLLREAYAEDADYLARFERELQLSQRIKSEHVVQVLGFGVRERLPYLALEYVDGPSLHQTLAGHGPYTWPDARALLTQIAQGLADAHAEGVIHRDLKPSNILIGSDGIAKLADFGIAKGLDLTRVTATSTLLGTPAYLAPEGPKDARSDLYSLGVIAFELLTGGVPFTGHTYQDVIVEHMRTPPDLAKLPAAARPIVGRLLAKNPGKRPESATEVVALLGRGGAPPRPATTQPTPPAAGPAVAPSGTRTSSVSSTVHGPRVSPTSPSRNRSAIAGLGAVACLVLIASVALAGGFLSGAGGTTGSRLAAGGLGTPSPASQTSPTTSPTPLPSPSFSAYPATAGDSAAMIAARFHVTLAQLAAANPQVTNWDGLAVGQVVNVPPSGSQASAKPGPTSTPGFSLTGSMSYSRSGHASTLLADGRVLVAGGVHGNSADPVLEGQTIAVAELYDPKTGSFGGTGWMNSARLSFTATLLFDGRVLVVGGYGGWSVGYFSSAELYDPQKGRFSFAGSMTTARSGHTATLLSDGRVLVAGGYSGSATVASAELYDPKTGTFSPTGSMASARSGHTATLLSDGRVLVAGGDSGSAPVASAELFDPKTGTFSPTGSMPSADYGHTATLLSDGRVLIAGGRAAELYDPKAETFSPTGPMSPIGSTGRSLDVATLLSDGRVLFVGGLAKVAELYDPSTGAFSSAGSAVASGRDYGYTATLLSDGRLLIAGGGQGLGNGRSIETASAEIYQP